MARRFGFKPSLREQRSAVARQLGFMASAAPDDKREQAEAFAASAQASIKPKRERGPRRDLEGPVVSAISELLGVHPRVLFAVRQNSGAASYEAKSGQYAPVHFYRILTGQPVTITDFWGILRDGRMLAIEAKAPGWKEPRTDREFKQAAFLMLVRNCGGIGIFATSADDVAQELK